MGAEPKLDRAERGAFIEKARELGCEEDRAKSGEVVRRIVKGRVRDDRRRPINEREAQRSAASFKLLHRP